jgi:hypothetical protein
VSFSNIRHFLIARFGCLHSPSTDLEARAFSWGRGRRFWRRRPQLRRKFGGCPRCRSTRLALGAAVAATQALVFRRSIQVIVISRVSFRLSSMGFSSFNDRSGSSQFRRFLLCFPLLSFSEL